MNLEQILKDIKKDVKIFGSVLINLSGIPLAADLPEGLDNDKIAMIVTTVLLTGEKGLMDTNYGTLDRISIRGKNGEMFLFKIKEDMILAVLAPKNTSYGILILSVKNAINRILDFQNGVSI
ncbi:MAG: roadblock/LC7 domain-containing protein [Candidatus Helarchaeota archaeon]